MPVMRSVTRIPCIERADCAPARWYSDAAVRLLCPFVAWACARVARAKAGRDLHEGRELREEAAASRAAGLTCCSKSLWMLSFAVFGSFGSLDR